MGLRLCLFASALALAGCSPGGATELLAPTAANANDDPAPVTGAANGMSGLLPFLAPAAPFAPAAPLAAGFIRADAPAAIVPHAQSPKAEVPKAELPLPAAIHPPLPPARPDFGDRVMAAVASPTLRPQTAPSAGDTPLQLAAFAQRASLAAYELGKRAYRWRRARCGPSRRT